jgi:hypothetical protein
VETVSFSLLASYCYAEISRVVFLFSIREEWEKLNEGMESRKWKILRLFHSTQAVLGMLSLRPKISRLHSRLRMHSIVMKQASKSKLQ